MPVIQTTPPLANFPGSTDKVIITSGQFASVLLDGSGSHDPDDAHFSFAWSENGIQLSSNEVTSVNLSLGDHKITFSLDDGFPLGTNSTSIEFEVISPAVAVARLSSLLQDSHGPDQVKQPLQASLSAAAASFDRDHENAGINQLGAFQSKLSARPRQLDSDLRENLMQGAQLIIDELRAEEN